MIRSRFLEPRLIGFDSRRFAEDVRSICYSRGLSVSKASIEMGICGSSLSHIKNKARTPDGITLAAICKWTKLNAGDYSIWVA